MHEIDIFDIIGPQFGGISTERVATELRAHRGKPVRVLINSPGGDASTGVAIHSLLTSHDGPVTVDIIGLAASAASVVAMAGKPIRIASAGMMMVHEPWAPTAGDAAKLRADADRLEKDSEALATIYARRTGKPAAAIRELMKAETWFTATEAIAEGFADEIVDALPVAACVRPEHLNIFSHMPAGAQRFVVGGRDTTMTDAERYDALPYLQRANLKQQDPVAFKRMREAWLISRGEDPAAVEARLDRRLFFGGVRINRRERPKGTSPLATTPTHEGKRYEELRPIEKHVLKQQNPDRFATMRADAYARGAL